MSSIVTAKLLAPAIAIIMALVAGSGTAIAQGQDAPEATPQGTPGRQQTAMCRMDEHIDGDLAFLKAELKITEAQTPQWNIFAQAFRSDREKRARACKEAVEQSKEIKSASLPDAMKMAEDQLSLRLDSLRSMKVAVQPLYDSLNKDQRKSADQIMRGGQIF
jgi:hypothetical protein